MATAVTPVAVAVAAASSEQKSHGMAWDMHIRTYEESNKRICMSCLTVTSLRC